MSGPPITPQLYPASPPTSTALPAVNNIVPTPPPPVADPKSPAPPPPPPLHSPPPAAVLRQQQRPQSPPQRQQTPQLQHRPGQQGQSPQHPKNKGSTSSTASSIPSSSHKSTSSASSTSSVPPPPPPHSPQQRPPPSRQRTLPVNPISASANDADIARRIWINAPDDKVRDALGRMLGWVEELTALLSQSYKINAELETALQLSRSNLQLALANTEMLEDALKRGDGRKDVGWRRWSDKEGAKRSSVALSEDGHVQMSLRIDNNHFDGTIMDRPSPSPSPAPPEPSPGGGSTGRFWKRFGSGGSSTSTAPGSKTPSPTTQQYGDLVSMASSSMPSLAMSGTPMHAPGTPMPMTPVISKAREDELLATLEKERKALSAERLAAKKALDDKSALEAEIETLSQALFEEANNMVAEERKRLAVVQDELEDAKTEKEALKGALKVIEQENGLLRVSMGVGGLSPIGSLRMLGDGSGNVSPNPGWTPVASAVRLPTPELAASPNAKILISSPSFFDASTLVSSPPLLNSVLSPRTGATSSVSPSTSLTNIPGASGSPARGAVGKRRATLEQRLRTGLPPELIPLPADAGIGLEIPYITTGSSASSTPKLTLLPHATPTISYTSPTMKGDISQAMKHPISPGLGDGKKGLPPHDENGDGDEGQEMDIGSSALEMDLASPRSARSDVTTRPGMTSAWGAALGLGLGTGTSPKLGLSALASTANTTPGRSSTDTTGRSSSDVAPSSPSTVSIQLKSPYPTSPSASPRASVLMAAGGGDSWRSPSPTPSQSSQTSQRSDIARASVRLGF